MKGKKSDEGKPELHLLPYSALQEAAKAAYVGKHKYGEYNYKEGIDWMRMANAPLRHVYSFISGKDYNEERFVSVITGEPMVTKVHHLGHAVFGLMMLFDAVANKFGKDSRYKPCD